jgi:hypothetical protein
MDGVFGDVLSTLVLSARHVAERASQIVGVFLQFLKVGRQLGLLFQTGGFVCFRLRTTYVCHFRFLPFTPATAGGDISLEKTIERDGAFRDRTPWR